MKLPHKFKIAVGGCPNNCVKPDLNDVGIIGQLIPNFDEESCNGCKKCAVVSACPMNAAKVTDGLLQIDGAKDVYKRQENPKCFDAITIPLVRSGEESGTLDTSLAKIASFMDDQDNLRKKIISAMTYPAVVIGIALLVLGVMVAVVIPQFEKAFSNLNIELPALTLMTFKFGRWMEHNLSLIHI